MDVYGNFKYRYIQIYTHIHTKIIVWCEDEERSIPLQVERKVKVKVNTRQRSAVATRSFTRVDDLQAFEIYQIYYKRI